VVAVRRRHVPPPVVTPIRGVNTATSVRATPAQSRLAEAEAALDTAEVEHLRAEREWRAALAAEIAAQSAPVPQLLRAREAAALLGLSVSATRALIDSGAIKRVPVHGRSVRVLRADVLAYIAARAGGAR
jgi:excisionase family DNA binding protein